MNEDHNYRKAPRVIMAVIMGIFLAGILSLITGAFIMLLWNWLMPDIFGLGVITYWQAFGLSLLAKLLLCSFGRMFPGGHNKWHDKRWHGYAKRCGKYKDWRFDDVYEQWWEKEGSESFESYMKKEKEEKQDKDQDKE